MAAARTPITRKQVKMPLTRKDSAAIIAKLADHDAALDGLEGATGSSSPFFTGVFTGRASAGAITLTGAKVGGKVVMMTNLTDAVAAGASFETTITVADQIQQSSGTDLSAKKFSFLIQQK